MSTLKTTNLQSSDASSANIVLGQGSGGGATISGVTTATTLKSATGTFTGNVEIAGDVLVAADIKHTGDTDTKIYFDTDTIKFDTAGTERVRITDGGGYLRMGYGGRIGINTANVNPYTDLHIANRDANLWLGNPLSGYASNQYPNIKIICDDPNKRAYIDQMYGGDNNYDRNITFGGTYLGLHSPGSANGAETVRITESKALFGNYFTSKTIGDTTSAIQIQGTDANTTSLTLFRYSANDSGPTITLGKGRASTAGDPDKPNDGDSLGQIRWMMANNNDLVNGYAAAIKCNVDAAPGGGDTPGRISFWTSPDASSTMAERMRIDNAGNIGINNTSPAYKLDVAASGTVVGRFRQNTNTTADTGTCLLLRHSGALSGQNGVGVLFQNSGGTKAGNINIGNSTVGYESGSDYRLKENEVAIPNGITRLKTLKPYRFNFKNEPPSITTEGFFAHEAQEVVPYAVSGEKDGEDMQSMDYGKLTPLLTAALQEAIAEIETLKTKVAALESA